jgi:hypothetical protein
VRGCVVGVRGARRRLNLTIAIFELAPASPPFSVSELSRAFPYKGRSTAAAPAVVLADKRR